MGEQDPFARLLCLDCPEGKFGKPQGGGADACLRCPLGKFKPGVGAKHCELKPAVEIDSLAKLPCLEACAKHFGGNKYNRKLACDIGCSISATGFGKKNLGYGIGERPYRVVKCDQLPTLEWTAACLDGMQFSGGNGGGVSLYYSATGVPSLICTFGYITCRPQMQAPQM